MLQTPAKSPTKSQVFRLGQTNDVYGGVQGVVLGGVSHGKFENDFDWTRLGTFSGPSCSGICRDPNYYNTCYYVKWNGNYGPPCGNLYSGNGCFANQPTATCALCLTSTQPYCCPSEQVPICGSSTVAVSSAVPVPLGTANPVYGGVQGGVIGGLTHGRHDSDFDWQQLSTWKCTKCGEVCRSPARGNQCYPVKANGYYGPPCGVLNDYDGYGCFYNEPTQTCALCTYPAQPYCCKYSDIPICSE